MKTTISSKRLKEILHSFKGQEMIVVGDIMLDHFIKGNVSRISPEAPVPVVAVNKEYFVAGGAGNVARVGELAVAIGHPSGADGSLPWTTTHGIISALDRVVSVSGGGKHGEMTMIQTDAPVNPGNSGGPLCNSRGEVIGIVTSKHTTYEGIGFAIPINNAMELLREIVETGSADGIESNVAKVRPTIGIGVRDIVEGDVYYDMQGKKYTAEKTGVLVSSVDETGAAYGSLQVRDIIIAMDGKTVETQNDLRELLYKHKSGDETTLVIWRDGQSKSVKIRLG